VQCRVLTGEYTTGKEGMKEPPLKPGSSTVRYNSTVDNANNPAIFVVFHDAEAYPEYLVEFKPKSLPSTG
jgi:poly [ADP-ribose] polymerase 10/14/15